ncbi:hypothetical protein B0H34DRAFT_712066 [Crassisporium funariophilum]|nr:hypothetical protein B0H34DRAFT_712066 [Crassisporium funariophilum]
MFVEKCPSGRCPVDIFYAPLTPQFDTTVTFTDPCDAWTSHGLCRPRVDPELHSLTFNFFNPGFRKGRGIYYRRTRLKQTLTPTIRSQGVCMIKPPAQHFLYSLSGVLIYTLTFDMSVRPITFSGACRHFNLVGSRLLHMGSSRAMVPHSNHKLKQRHHHSSFWLLMASHSFSDCILGHTYANHLICG